LSLRALLQRWLHGRWYGQSSPQKNSLGVLDQEISRRLLLRRQTNVQVNRQQKPPIVVIGNLVVGGGGKSPTVAYLTKQLQQAGKRVAIITSGYGGKATHAREITAQDDPRLHGDESIMLAKLTGARIFSAKQRAQAYALAIAKCQPDIVLSDDGLQHFLMPRALQLVCLDERLIGNGKVLPFGPLREPVSVLAKMDGLIVPANTSREMLDTVIQRQAHLPLFYAATTACKLRQLVGSTEFNLTLPHENQRALAALQAGMAQQSGRAMILIAGIANPDHFAALIHQTFAGVQTSILDLADHDHPRTDQIQSLKQNTVVMTEKDAVKWLPAARALGLTPQHWWVLGIERHTEPDLGRFVLEQFA
jgi:tetraacyldisaccharide 4'-kinase